jgi:hypothetical protein
MVLLASKVGWGSIDYPTMPIIIPVDLWKGSKKLPRRGEFFRERQATSVLCFSAIRKSVN